MRYLLVGSCFCLAGFLAMDLVASGWMAALFALGGDRARGWSAARRRCFFAACRVLPCAAGLLFVALVAAPGYVRLEPRDARETIGLALVLTTLCAIGLLARGPLRAIAAWRATRRMEAAWLRTADRLDLPLARVAVWRVRGDAVGLWTSGLVRPRLIVGASVLDALGPAELAAAIRHELAHAASRDNLVRLCLLACPGALSVTRLGRTLERNWARASEAAADCRATAGMPAAAVELASALVKVARLRVPGTVLVASALDEGDVALRVRSLLSADPAPRVSRLPEVGAWAALSVPLAAVAALSVSPTIVRVLHSLAEQLVRRF